MALELNMKAMQADYILIYCGIALLLFALQVLGGLKYLFNVYTALAVISLILWRNWKSAVIIVKTLPRDLRLV